MYRVDFYMTSGNVQRIECGDKARAQAFADDVLSGAAAWYRSKDGSFWIQLAHIEAIRVVQA